MNYSAYNFRLKKTEFIEEIDSTVHSLVHSTGAQLLLIENEDKENVFSIAFRTPIQNSYGIPHILEHSALQGSKKYPLKDAFGELIKSSPATFINAFTFPDKTMFPIATTNTQDLYNCMELYLDMVFFPLLTENTLKREGWHYEFDEETKKIIYKGVVYNEMWGAYANANSEIIDKTFMSLFCDTIYKYDSGGNPLEIPHLKYDEILKFHKKYYHPSNSFSCLYGSDRSEKRLHILDTYFSQFEATKIESQIKIQPLETIPKNITKPLVNYTDIDRGTTLRSFVFSPTATLDDTFDRYLEGYYLFGTSGSPLYLALMESGLGDEVFSTGLDAGSPQFDHFAQKWVAIGLKNTSINSFDTVQNLITKTIMDACQNINTDNLLSSLNSIEFSLREGENDGSPKGLNLFVSIMRSWLYEADEFDSIRWKSRLASIQKYKENPETFAHNIKTYWLEYPYQTRIDLVPNEEAKTSWHQKPIDELASYQSSLNHDQIEQIKAEQKELTDEQLSIESEEIKSLIPIITLDQIDKYNEIIPQEITTDTAHTQLYHPQNTNEIIYTTITLDCNHLGEEYLEYYTLFCEMLTESGTHTKSKSEIQFLIGTYTGGVSFSPMVRYTLSKQLTLCFEISVKVLPQYCKQASELIIDLLHNSRLSDKDTIKYLINQARSRYETSLPSLGRGYMSGIINSSLNIAGHLSSKISGITHYQRIIDLEKQDTLDTIATKLEKIRSIILTQKNCTSNITTNKHTHQHGKELITTIINSLSKDILNLKDTNWFFEQSLTNKAYTVPTKVNSLIMGFHLEQNTSTYPSASIHVINNYLTMVPLWEKIRLVGGAYGTRSGYTFGNDIQYIYSYRDPNIDATIDIFNSLGKHLESVEISPKEVIRNCIGTIGNFTPHLLPNEKGDIAYSRYLTGITNEYLQHQRDQILSTTISDFHTLGQQITTASQSSIIGVLGNADLISQSKTKFDITKLIG